MSEDFGTGEQRDEEQQRRRKRRSDDCCDAPVSCGPDWGLCGDGCGDGCGDFGCLGEFDPCLVSLTTLIGGVGGLAAAVAGTGTLGRRLRSETRAPGSPVAAALHRGVRYYQVRLSARRPGYGGCRYTPTCSAYAAESLRRHGAVRGVRLAVGRLRRCRPGTVGGVDLVP